LISGLSLPIIKIIMSTTNVTNPKKKAIPRPGRKMSAAEAREHVNRKFGKALAKLAK